jgi:hypothetical protein
MVITKKHDQKTQQFWPCYRGISTLSQKPTVAQHRHRELLLCLPLLLPLPGRLLTSGTLMRQRSAEPQEKLLCDGRGAKIGLSF